MSDRIGWTEQQPAPSYWLGLHKHDGKHECGFQRPATEEDLARAGYTPTSPGAGELIGYIEPMKDCETWACVHKHRQNDAEVPVFLAPPSPSQGAAEAQIESLQQSLSTAQSELAERTRERDEASKACCDAVKCLADEEAETERLESRLALYEKFVAVVRAYRNDAPEVQDDRHKAAAFDAIQARCDATLGAALSQPAPLDPDNPCDECQRAVDRPKEGPLPAHCKVCSRTFGSGGDNFIPRTSTPSTHGNATGEPDKCPVRGVPCPEHGFEHGKEAEELREGIEGLIGKDYDAASDVLEDLQLLLDKVDARDSLAWREATEQQPPAKGCETVCGVSGCSLDSHDCERCEARDLSADDARCRKCGVDGVCQFARKPAKGSDTCDDCKHAIPLSTLHCGYHEETYDSGRAACGAFQHKPTPTANACETCPDVATSKCEKGCTGATAPAAEEMRRKVVEAAEKWHEVRETWRKSSPLTCESLEHACGPETFALEEAIRAAKEGE